MTKTRAQIEAELMWFRDLLDTLRAGDTDSVENAIRAAIQMLEVQSEQTPAEVFQFPKGTKE